MLKYFFTFFCILIFSSVFTYGQYFTTDRQKDSLGILLTKTNNDTLKADLLVSYAKYFFYNDQDSALIYLNQALIIAEKYKKKKLMGIIYTNIGICQTGIKSYETSIKYLTKALDIAAELNDTNLVARTSTNIGVNYFYLKNYDSALPHFFKALFLDSIRYRYNFVADNLNNIGNIYRIKNDYNTALNYLQSGLMYAKKSKNNIIIAELKVTLGQIFSKLKKYDIAIKLLNEAIVVAKEINIDLMHIEANLELAHIYNKLNNPKKSIAILNESIQLPKNINNDKYMSLFFREYAESYKIAKNYPKAIEYYEKIIKFDDSLNVKEISNEVLNIQKRYESDKKDELIKLRDLELKNNAFRIQNQFILIIAFAVICSIILIFSIIIYRTLVKLKLKNFELNEKNDKIKNQLIEINDITNQLQNQRDDLILLNSKKDKFFSIIAHDLRNPLGGMLNLLDLLSKDYDKLNYKMINDIINSLSKAAGNTYTLLENLLQWARTQTGGIDFNPEYIKLYDLIQRNVDLTSTMAQTKSINLTFVCKSEYFVQADANLLNTIIRNLITNAIKFTPNSGEIHISTFLNENDSNFITVQIQDSGIGISSNHVNQLFELKNTASRKGTNNESGSGLGLVLCKEFVERMGGRIWVESEEGKGSTFIFTLPVV